MGSGDGRGGIERVLHRDQVSGRWYLDAEERVCVGRREKKPGSGSYGWCLKA